MGGSRGEKVVAGVGQRVSVTTEGEVLPGTELVGGGVIRFDGGTSVVGGGTGTKGERGDVKWEVFCWSQ